MRTLTIFAVFALWGPGCGDEDRPGGLGADADADTDGDSDTDGDTGTDADTDTDTDTDVDTDTDTDTGTGTDTGSETDTGTGTDTGSDTGTGTDTDTPFPCEFRDAEGDVCPDGFEICPAGGAIGRVCVETGTTVECCPDVDG